MFDNVISRLKIVEVAATFTDKWKRVSYVPQKIANSLFSTSRSSAHRSPIPLGAGGFTAIRIGTFAPALENYGPSRGQSNSKITKIDLITIKIMHMFEGCFPRQVCPWPQKTSVTSLIFSTNYRSFRILLTRICF